MNSAEFGFWGLFVNPLTPVLAVTSPDKRWPLFHFWHLYLWPKLASSVFKFCRGERSFHWYPDQSNMLSGAWNTCMHKNAQKFDCKTWSKFACNYAWLFHGKICQSQWCFLRNFGTGSKPSWKVNHCSEKIRKREKGKCKKTRNFDFCLCPSKNVLEHGASAKKGMLSCCKCIFE